MSHNPLRSSPRQSVWERLEAASGRRGPETPLTEPSTASDPLASEINQVLIYLQNHFADLLADPMARPRNDIVAAIHEAVSSRDLRKAEADRLVERLIQQLLGAGVLAPYFADPAVTEIMVNGPKVYIEREGKIVPGATLPSAGASEQLARLLAHHEGLEYQSTRPIMNFMWSEDGSRINMVHHSKSPTGVVITIRKRNQERSLDLDDLLHAGMLSPDAAALLVSATEGRLNTVISGPPGSGKTSVLRAIAYRGIPVTERVITLEDTEELRLAVPHLVALIGQTERPSVEERTRGVITLQDLFRNTLRQRYDRLIMGELRGPEALDFLEAAMSSEGGMMTTIHLRKPELLVDRLYQIAHKHQIAMPFDLIQQVIYDTVDLVVQVDRDGAGHRHLSRIVEVSRDGTMSDLFLWDPASRTLVAKNPLSPDRQAWAAAHTRRPFVTQQTGEGGSNRDASRSMGA